MAGRARALQVHDFPPNLWRMMKARAALRGITQRDAVVEAVRQWLDQQAEREQGPDES